MSKTIEMIKAYKPYNEQEEKDKQYFIECEQIEQILTRENKRCHLCATAIILNKTRDKGLFVFHNIYKSWTWVGGHADGLDNMQAVAEKEAKEETSIPKLRPLLNTPISIEALPVAGHYKKGEYVPAHTHLSVEFLFEADEREKTIVKPDENTNVAWIELNKMVEISSEPHMKPIYLKIIEKIKDLKAKQII